MASEIKIPDIKFNKLFINGHFIDSVSGKTFQTIDPRTGDVVAEVAEGDKEDVDIAVKAAREAFDHGRWPRMSGYERGRLMNKLADLIEEHGEDLAMLDSIDAGKLLHATRAYDIKFATNSLRYYAGAADKIHGETLKCEGEFQAYTLKEPVGVVGHIIPWNIPTLLFIIKVAPALAAGCTMVVKPAEQSPLSALYLAHLVKMVFVAQNSRKAMKSMLKSRSTEDDEKNPGRKRNKTPARKNTTEIRRNLYLLARRIITISLFFVKNSPLTAAAVARPRHLEDPATAKAVAMARPRQAWARPRRCSQAGAASAARPRQAWRGRATAPRWGAVGEARPRQAWRGRASRAKFVMPTFGRFSASNLGRQILGIESWEA